MFEVSWQVYIIGGLCNMVELGEGECLSKGATSFSFHLTYLFVG